MQSPSVIQPPEADTAANRLAAFVRFCAALILEDGRPLVIEQFQQDALLDYFGGATETLILLPKKNGKSTLMAALALFHLCTTPDAECLIAAASRDQATILYDQAGGFVRRSPGLDKRCVVKRGYREIRSLRDHGRIRVLAADADTADGVIPTLALMDELHRQKSLGLYGVFRDGLGPRNGQMVTISTAGDSEATPLGVMRAQARTLPIIEVNGRHLYAKSADGSWVMHEWALFRDDDPDDLEVVKLANPASWQTVGALARRRDSPSMLPAQWLRFACGLWMGSEAWWVTGEQWRAAQAPVSTQRIRPGDRITLGFDGSRTGDSTALVACRVADGLLEVVQVWARPQDGKDWEVPGASVDAAIAHVMETYDVVRGYFDPPLWQSEIERWQHTYGAPSVTAFHTNRTQMMGAVERFRTDLLHGSVMHNGDPVLAEHVLNTQTKEVRGGYWLTKDAPSSPRKIDAAIAAVLAYEARCDALSTTEAPRALLAF